MNYVKNPRHKCYLCSKRIKGPKVFTLEFDAFAHRECVIEYASRGDRTAIMIIKEYNGIENFMRIDND